MITRDGTRFDDLLVAGATWALVAALAWGGAVAVALLLEALTRGRLRSTWACPPSVRRALLGGLGLVVSSGALGVPVLAAPPRPGPVSTGAPATGLPSPERPTGGLAPRAEVRVVVRRGDTLWALAAAALPRGAPDAAVAALVTRTHRLNRQVIGPDPDRLVPGQRLRVPHPRPAREIQP